MNSGSNDIKEDPLICRYASCAMVTVALACAVLAISNGDQPRTIDKTRRGGAGVAEGDVHQLQAGQRNSTDIAISQTMTKVMKDPARPEYERQSKHPPMKSVF